MLGVAYYHDDDYPHAIELLAPIVRQFPRDSLDGRETVQVLGLSVLPGRPHPRRRFRCSKKPARGPLTTSSWRRCSALAYIQTRQPDKAVAPLAQAFGAEPGSAGAHLLAAQMMVRLEFNDMADEQLRTALALDPRLPHGTPAARAERRLQEPARGGHRITSARSSRPIPETPPRSTGSVRLTRASRIGTRPSPRSSGRSGSTRTSAAPTSSSAGRISRRRSRQRPKACCAAPSSTTRTTSPRDTCTGRSCSGSAVRTKRRSSSTLPPGSRTAGR